MKMKLTLLKGFKIVGEGTLTLHPEVVDTSEQKLLQAECVARWMLATETAINANGPLRAHLEMIDD